MKKKVIKDVCNFVGGSQPPKSVFISEYKEGYIRFIQTRDYKTDGFLTYIPVSTARRFCDDQDIMIGRYGPPVFQILRGIKGTYNVALMKAIPKPNIINDYLYYLLKQEAIFKYVEGLSLRTGGQTGVDLVSLNQYPILLPEIAYQQIVIDVLKSLDSKIEINYRINSELETMAKMLYEYWFVQFDFPDIDGKPYKTSGGKMVWNDELKRDIPDGWVVGTVLDVSELLGGGTPKTKEPLYWNGTIPFFTPKDTEDSFYVLSTQENITELGLNSCSSKLYSKGTIFITARGTVGKVNIASKDMAMNQSCYAIKPKQHVNSFYLHQCVNDFVKHLKAKANGSIFDAIVSNDFKQTPIVIPPLEYIRNFGCLSENIYEKILNNRLQSQSLSELRDWLLPMLMNGQVKVN